MGFVLLLFTSRCVVCCSYGPYKNFVDAHLSISLGHMCKYRVHWTPRSSTYCETRVPNAPKELFYASAHLRVVTGKSTTVARVWKVKDRTKCGLMMWMLVSYGGSIMGTPHAVQLMV